MSQTITQPQVSALTLITDDFDLYQGKCQWDGDPSVAVAWEKDGNGDVYHVPICSTCALELAVSPSVQSGTVIVLDPVYAGKVGIRPSRRAQLFVATEAQKIRARRSRGAVYAS